MFNGNRKDSRPDTSFKFCTHCLVMLPEKMFRRAKTEICNECEEAPGFVYVVHNTTWPKCYKIGITQNPPRRLEQYNAPIPYADTEFIFVKGSGFYEQIERELKSKFSANRIIKQKRTEWLNGINDPQEIIDSIIYFHEELKALKTLEI